MKWDTINNDRVMRWALLLRMYRYRVGPRFPDAQMISPEVQIKISPEAQGPCVLQTLIHNVAHQYPPPPNRQVWVKHDFIDAETHTFSICYSSNNCVLLCKFVPVLTLDVLKTAEDPKYVEMAHQLSQIGIFCQLPTLL